MSEWYYRGEEMDVVDFQDHGTAGLVAVGKVAGEVVSFPVRHRHGMPEPRCVR